MYQIGDRVRIKDKIPFHFSDHPARKYAGTVTTVKKVDMFPSGNPCCYRMEEDQEECGGNGWVWYYWFIDGFAEDFEEPFDDSAFPEITFEELLAGTIPERGIS